MESSKIKNPAAISHLKYFHIMCCLYVGTVLVSITQASRLIPINIPMLNFSVLITGGTLTIPLAFFIQNIVTEVYGYSKSRHLIQLSLAIVGCCIFYEYLLTFFPLAEDTIEIQKSYNNVFKSIPRHIIAFILSAFCGTIINDYLISKSKIYFHGEYLRLRFIFATAAGEAVYMFFAFLVWIMYLNIEQIFPIIIISYLYRIAFEGATLPLSYYFTAKLKEFENIDIYDFNINYNPFLFYSTGKEHNE